MRRICVPLALVAAAALAATSAVAGATGASLAVTIALAGSAAQPPSAGACVSRVFSEPLGSLVEVACEAGHFVSIVPRPIPLPGLQGATSRYVFSAGDGLGWLPDSTSLLAGTGTVTALRVYRLGGPDGPIEMLVSF